MGELWASYCTKAGKESKRKEKKKMILLPCSLRVQGKKTMVPFQNGTVLRFFFCIYYFVDFELGFVICFSLLCIGLLQVQTNLSIFGWSSILLVFVFVVI